MEERGFPCFKNMVKAKVIKTVNKYKLLGRKDIILAAVSGGPDSVCMLYLLAELSAEIGFKLSVFHLDHQLRGENSRQDAKFVKNLSSKLGLPCFLYSFNVQRYQRISGLSMQEAARRVRMRLMSRAAERIRANKIALGHNADDQVETIIMRILRGTGLDGLTGMGIFDSFPGRTEALIIRPLLEASREEIEQFLREGKISYRIDRSNLKPVYLRNKIRLELIPYLEKNYNPALKKGLLQMCKILSLDNSYLLKETDNIYPRLVQEESAGRVILKIPEIIKCDEAIQFRVIRKGLKNLKGHLRAVEAKHVENILELIKGAGAHRGISLPGGVLAKKSYQLLELKMNEKKEIKCFTRKRLTIPGKTYVPELDMEIEAQIRDKDNLPWPPDQEREAYLDYEKLVFPLYLSLRWPGIKFQPLGMEGTKKLKDFLIDERVPLEVRDRTLLVLSKDEIVWVAGFRIAHPFRLTANSKKVLVLRLKN